MDRNRLPKVKVDTNRETANKKASKALLIKPMKDKISVKTLVECCYNILSEDCRAEVYSIWKMKASGFLA